MFEIDPDIRKAFTLPADFYTEPRYFELSKEKIFARTWQFLGRADEAETLWPATILPGFLDEPVVVIKTSEWISCMSNVCTHRGKVLVEEPCEAASLIRCGYHGRRFGLDGTCLSMPEFDGVEGFPAETDHLVRLPFSVRQGFMFASLEPVAPFEAFVDDLVPHLSDIDLSGLRRTSSKVYSVNAHWALYCENYLEGFHIPYVHQALNAVVDYGTYTTEIFRYASIQTGYDADGAVAARYVFVFPNMMFNFYPWGLSINIVRPLTPSLTEVEFITYMREDASVEGGAGADLDTVELEDEAVVESVQRGIRSRFYTRGRYSPTREQGTHHFHRLIAEFNT